MQIIEWCNKYSGFIIGALTLIYVETTIWLLTSNRRIRMQNSDIQKQNVRIQLFEKRYEVYKETGRFFIELIKNGYCALTVLALSMESDEYNFDFGFGKIRYLFGEKNYEDAKNVNATAGDVNKKLCELSNVYEYISTRMDKNGEFKRATADTPPKALLNPNNADVKAISDKYELKGITFGFETPRDYNYYDLHMEKGKIESEFHRGLKCLLANMEKELYINDI